MVNTQLLAAQNKLVIAQAIGDRSMWDQAMLSMKGIFEAARQTEDGMLNGHVNPLSMLNVDDVICNYDMYGDLIVVDGDLLLGMSIINTDIINH